MDTNREAWLTELMIELTPLLKEQGKRLPKFRIACGWPVTRGRPRVDGGHRVGECWGAECSADGTHEIFISPTLSDPVKIADIALHEACHAVLPPGTGHKAPFAKLAVALGLEGKPTATEAGPALIGKLKEITDKLGPYPHAALDGTGRKKQPTRLLKVMCMQCGYVIRVTSKWIEEAGCPYCPECQIEMSLPGEDDEVQNPLHIVEQSIEFELRGRDDDRFRIRLYKRKRGAQWCVLDYGETGFFATSTARVVPAEGREDAINLVESLEAGLLTHAELEERIDTLRLDEEQEADPEEDWRDLQFLQDDEAEFPDDLSLILTPEEEAEYERNEKIREAKAKESTDALDNS